MPNLDAELRTVWPDGTLASIGKHEVFRHHDETPAHKYDAIVKFLDSSRLVELTARDSFDEYLSEFILDGLESLRIPALRSECISVSKLVFPTPWLFECVVVAPPRIAARFETESANLAQATFWVIPTFTGEFKHGENTKSFWHQVRRKDGWRSDVVKWDRVRKTAPTFD